MKPKPAAKARPSGWVMFTKRTNEPKLSWLERQLDAARIPHRRAGESWHAPITQVPAAFLEPALAILRPVDDTPDDNPRFLLP